MIGRVWLSIVMILFLSMALPAATSYSASLRQICADIGANPVLQDSGWHPGNPGPPGYNVRYFESSVVKQGNTFAIYVGEIVNNTGGIFRGTSSNGVNWTMSSSPVITKGNNGSWDSQGVLFPNVVWNGTGYLMYYVGDGVTTSATFPANFRQIGVAFSADGVHWSKYAGNPVITHGPGSYDARYTRGPSVIFDNGTYKMWYAGTSAISSTTPLVTTIDYATSADGKHWTKFSGNPVFKGFNESNSTFAFWPSVVKANGTFLMAFGDGFQNIGFASSSNGISWRFDNNSNILLTWAEWHNGYVSNPSLLLDGQQLRLWYYGIDNSNQSLPHKEGVGFATCGILVAQHPVTTTSTATVTTTNVLISTTTVVSEKTTQTTVTTALSTGVPAFDITTVLLGGLLAVALAALLLSRRRPS
jgi:predicted GH43/DUF377 family glycosyl hydrolase